LPPFHVVGFDENIESQGELILQESFQVWDPKTLIRKGRERHLFLFEMSLVFSKEVKDSSGRSKYLYKSKLFVSICLQNSKSIGNKIATFFFRWKKITVCCLQFNLPNYSKMWVWIVITFSSSVKFFATPSPLEGVLEFHGFRKNFSKTHCI
jgi:hypothetical protein